MNHSSTVKKDARLGIVIVGTGDINLDSIIKVAQGKAQVKISTDRRFVARMMKTQNMLEEALQHEVAVYGVNTGYGKSCGKRLSMKKQVNRQANLMRFHGCGTGEPIGIEETRAAILCRILCLARGYSGVSIDLLERMADLLNYGITPVVPSEGSVGASGDLTPMFYIVAALAGEGEVFFQGKRMPSKSALQKTNLKPYKFKLKEPISMLNGTTVMTGIAAMVVFRTRKIMNAAVSATALTVHAMKGHVHHYHPVISQAKPFPGQILISGRLTQMLQAKGSLAGMEADTLETLQDPYSIRCVPQIMGVLCDALEWVSAWVEREANSSNDNPIFDPSTGQPLMGGNFYGGYIAFAMDALKSAVASVADMSDRQMALLVDPNLNRGLPGDLVRDTVDKSYLHHGFKAMSIATSALAAEALKGTMPAASFSRPTESNNQDKVSMGTIAARDAERICTLVERVVAIHLMAAAQACEIRDTYRVRPKLADLIKKIRTIVQPTIEDRPMDRDIENMVRAIRGSDFFSPGQKKI